MKSPESETGMSLPALIENYGYAAVFIGSFLEGETVVLLAGFAAHRGYLDIYLVALVAFAASFIGDQFYFYLGHRHGQRLLARFPSLQARTATVQALLQRYHTPLILMIRFMYGLRTVGPIAIGIAKVPWPRFFALNLVGALIWAPVVAGGGYLFGRVLQLLLDDVKRYEEMAFLSLAVLSFLVWLAYRLKQWKFPHREQ
jgi:membrane protein DedA with SNARE-associated domain